ncbi:MAG: hypothetical protein ACLGPM_06110 [Acidobacteriota bacterium]
MDTVQQGSNPGGTQSSAWRRRILLYLLALLAGSIHLAAQATGTPVTIVPQKPEPRTLVPSSRSPLTPCDVRNAGASMAATAAIRAITVRDASDPDRVPNPRIVGVTLCVPHLPMINWYARFLNGPQVKAFTPLQKAHLAARDVFDPFNILTIAGEGMFSIGLNAHTPEGPGLRGYGHYVGVSFTQDMVGEFFGTFLIPSFAHQDPHYHRMPQASIPRRVLHAIDQVVWTQGDNGKMMVNYADIVGFGADEEINNLFVPGLETDGTATAARYATDLATAPIDNFITEFLPDIASHIHVRIVLVQRIINQVASTNSAEAP